MNMIENHLTLQVEMAKLQPGCLAQFPGNIDITDLVYHQSGKRLEHAIGCKMCMAKIQTNISQRLYIERRPNNNAYPTANFL